jgi:PEP-CTERM motif
MWMAVAGAVLTAVPAYAVPITPSPTVVSGNITFNNFVCTSPSPGLPCGSISVNPYVSATPPDPVPGEFGIRLTGAFNAAPGAFNDTVIQYDAHITGSVFTDASMFYNGTPISSIAEQIYSLDTNNLIGTLFVENPPADFTDHVVLSEEATNIRVVKDIQYIGGDRQATISIIDQTFSQQVPEPATVGLLGTALLAMGLITYRRRYDA